ncbi:single-stranded-DNA-specific exonuclease RecJ [Carboxydothermus hydrogenoformans]|uniref:Single-stranded-DNA-specific exonuclease RecJ n=1 Tax=Carboxydothermus hydrogenoformans (strain ATCC BAA-161 / DSM 6008 / Z-2901) TaxID=246194 RepID=Q3A9Z7_CARHZ|nr:single-stranded-DNA-specific exonuclease RecJ [Carboxydothermus hydrogenoformans]ABB14584.1 single-stranded DNA-specific exonuclease RecJ [Carboxydothermus hydrogenoformans Z-2901]
MEKKNWLIFETSHLGEKYLEDFFRIEPLTAKMLVNRGIFHPRGVRRFFWGNIDDTYSPYLLKDMEKAVKLILSGRNTEKFLIYGDYDADGLTSTALLYDFLRKRGFNVDWYIPNRLDEGYGLHLPPLVKALEEGISFIISVDCGITAVDEVKTVREMGAKVVITDHHEPQEEIPVAEAVINPKQKDCPYPFKGLAGVGVALKLVLALGMALGEREEDILDQYLDLFTVGTIADIVPLVDENRIFVIEGLKRLAATGRPGLKALKEVAQLNREEITTRDVGFILSPRLNAAGRLKDPALAFELLIEENYERALALAYRLSEENQNRQGIEAEIFKAAVETIEREVDLDREKILIIGGDGWHPGVIGIVASKLMEKYYRPVILISFDGEEGKGSGRSVFGFNLFEALKAVKDYLTHFGGHERAVGVGVLKSRFLEFKEALLAYAEKHLPDELLLPKIEVEEVVGENDLNLKISDEIALFAPFGEQNPEPLFLIKGGQIRGAQAVGKNGNHLKFNVKLNREIFSSIAFSKGDYLEFVYQQNEVDLAFIPKPNRFNGKTELQLNVKEIAPGEGRIFKVKKIKEKELNTIEEELSLLAKPYCYKFANHPEKVSFARRINKLNQREFSFIKLAGTKKTLVVTANLAEMYGQALELWENGFTLLPYCPELRETFKEKALKKYRETGILLTSEQYLPEALNFTFEQIIFTTPPLLLDVTIPLLTDYSGSLGVLANKEDLKILYLRLVRILPQRDKIAKVYMALRQKLLTGNPFTFSEKELFFNAFGDEMRVKDDYLLLISILKVLTELNLIKIWEEDGKKWVFLFPPSQDKINLEISSTYARAKEYEQNLREYFKVFYPDVL